MARSVAAALKQGIRIETGGWLVCAAARARCGCFKARIAAPIWITRSASHQMAQRAASTAVICLAFASLASRAVLSWLLTPMRIMAESGATATVASPVTVTSFSIADDGSGASETLDTIDANRTRERIITSPARTH